MAHVYSILYRERLPRNWVDLGRSTYKMHRLLNIRNLLSHNQAVNSIYRHKGLLETRKASSPLSVMDGWLQGYR